MKRDDNSKFLLYIEPSRGEKLTEPINDELTKLIEFAITRAKEGAANYSDISSGQVNFREGSGFRGTHRTDCGERSSNIDYLLENGMVTNSLATFYVKWYRYSIPENDMNKLKSLAFFYDVKI